MRLLDRVREAQVDRCMTCERDAEAGSAFCGVCNEYWRGAGVRVVSSSAGDRIVDWWFGWKRGGQSDEGRQAQG